MQINKKINENQIFIKNEINRNFQGLLIGAYSNRLTGFSLDFKNFKPYYNGDNIKFIDWKLWAKTEKLYLKEFDNESNTDINFIIDNSLSMDRILDEKFSKFEYQLIIVGVLSLFFLNKSDIINFFFLSGNKIIKKKVTNQADIFSTINEIIKIGFSKKNTITEISKIEIKKNSLVYVISDFLFDNFNTHIKELSFNREIHVFQILSNFEINLKNVKKSNFIDKEFNKKIFIEPKKIIHDYKKEFNNWNKNLKKFVLNLQGMYFLFQTNNPIQEILLAYLNNFIKAKK